MVTTWSHADEVLAAHAELDIRAGGGPRPHLVAFEGSAATLAALGPKDRRPTCTRSIIELTELVAAVGAERFALGVDLRDDHVAARPPAERDRPLTVAAVTAPRVHARILAWPGRWRRRTRLRAVSYGRGDDGAPVWGRPRIVWLRRRTTLRLRLTEVIGDDRGTQPAELVAAYLLRSGYTIGTADGWAARYGLDALSGH